MDKYAAAELIRRIPGSGTVAVDEPMSRHTSFRIGGPADVFIRPETIESAADILKACKENGIPAIVIGNGTNLIVRDKGIR
ncbi:MAG: FAD-binding protein, partial [Acetivibrionales bacterium]